MLMAQIYNYASFRGITKTLVPIMILLSTPPPRPEMRGLITIVHYSQVISVSLVIRILTYFIALLLVVISDLISSTVL